MAEITEEIISTAEDLARSCSYLASCPTIGLDTEFVGEDTYVPRLCLIQISTPEKLLLIDPFTCGPLDTFWNLLLDPTRVVIVHAGREEVRLCRLWSGHPPANIFDLQIAAGLAGLHYPMGHGTLVNQLLGTRLAKGETLTEWRRRPLTPEQLRYAFDDVRYLIAAWTKLRERLEKLDRLDWACEEFQRLSILASPEDPAMEERWRKLKGSGSLDRRKLAVVKALFHWREQRAAHLNRPARTVLRDDLIVEIARRNPMRARDLQVVRGMPNRDLDAIVEVVAEARKLLLDQCPEQTEREQDPPQFAIISGVLIAVLGDLCLREKLAVSLVASNTDLRAIVRARLTGKELPEEISLTRGWRAKHLLPELLAVLEGKRTVRIASLHRESPLELADLPRELS